MAKWNRKTIGSVVKSKDGGADYIKISNDVVLSKGSTLRLESAKAQMDSVLEAEATGKLNAETAAKVKERIAKIPLWVRFDIVLLEKV